MKKILAGVAVSLLAITSAYAAGGYKSIDCSSDPVFASNSCTQCFDGGQKAEGTNLGLLTDVWSNGTSKAMYMLKEENTLDSAVKMISLNGASWSYEPQKDGFWQYTDNLEKLADSGFYKLDAGKSVDWIESKLGYSIKLNKGAEAGKNIGLLKYVINVRVENDGVPSEQSTSHSECVLFKSAGKSNVVPPKKQQPKKLPQTGPQEILLLLLSLILAGSIFFFSRKKA